MSDNSNSANGNSWTILTPEESAVESVGPRAEADEGHGGEVSSPAAPETHTGSQTAPESLPSETEPVLHTEPEPSTQAQAEFDTSPGTEHLDGPSEESPQVTPLETTEDSGLLNSAHLLEEAGYAKGAPGSLDEQTSLTSDPGEHGASAATSEIPAPPSLDTDSFSDSYTHISPSPELSAPPGEVTREEEGLRQDEEEPVPGKTETGESPPDVAEDTGREGDGLRRRKVSLLGSLDQPKRGEDEEDEEGEEEEFRLPQREEETGFSLNKCILGAVILLGLGTIFFSGILMDLDEEGDIDVKELKDPELLKSEGWINPAELPAGLQAPETLDKLAKENQQIAVLQAQLQAQTGELKAAQLQVEEGAKERTRREELEKENQKIKEELDKLPVLQRELEKEKERVQSESEKAKKELESMPALQKELETLKAKVTQLSHGPGSLEELQITPSGRAGDVQGSQDGRRGRDIKDGKKSFEKEKTEKKQKKGGEKEAKVAGKEQEEWKKDGKKGKPWKEKGSERKEGKDQKDWKTEKSHPDKEQEWRGKGERKDRKEKPQGKDGKGWKDGGGKKDFNEMKEEKHLKKEKHRGWDGGKEKEGKKKPWQEEKEWKKEKQGSNGIKDKKEKAEKKREWKEKEEWKGENDWRKKKGDGKDKDKEWREKGDKKWKEEKEYHKGKDGKKEWKGKEEKKYLNEKEREWSKDGVKKKDAWKEGKKDDASSYKEREKSERHDKGKRSKEEKKDWNKKEKHWHGSSDRSSHLHTERQKRDKSHGDYWTEQKERLHHHDGPKPGCSGVADCAQAEGLNPVSLSDFEALLLGYLSKIQSPMDQSPRKEELSKLVKEFFPNGVFAHDQIPFSEFVEDVADILEDMVEGEESEEQEDEMEEFEKEAIEKFALPDRGEKIGEKKRWEGKKESSRVKG